MPIFLDYETWSSVDLSKHGAYRYAEQAKIVCAAVSLGSEVTVCRAGELLPPDILAAIDRGEPVVAHNIEFERRFWREKFGSLGAPFANIKKVIDTAAIARNANIAGNLEQAAEQMGLIERKIPLGKKKLLQLTEAPTDELYEYAAGDVKTTVELYGALPKMSENDQSAFNAVLAMNERGIGVDMEYVQAAASIADELIHDVARELSVATSGEITSPHEVARILKFVRKYDDSITNITSETVATLIRSTGLPDEVKKVLLLRQAGADAASKKYAAILDRVCADGRLRGQFVFRGASQTGRMSSYGVQAQNLRRGRLSNELREATLTGIGAVRELAEKTNQHPLGLLANAVRGSFAPGPGKIFIKMDLSQIELRLAYWLAGETDRLRAVEEGVDPYIDFAAQFLKKPREEVTKGERQQYKACFAAGTKVLTDSGWKNIETISSRDKIWDENFFVSCDGVTSKWTDKIINLGSIRCTPDHLVWNGRRWSTAARLVTCENVFFRALETAAAHLPHSVPSLDYVTAIWQKTVGTAAAFRNYVQKIRNWKKKTPRREKVYDLVNVGPQHRYMVLTDRGPLVVHNCVLGGQYMLGPARLRDYALAFGVELTEKEAVAQITGYRKLNKRIVDLWGRLQRAVETAFANEDKNVVLNNGLRFQLENNCLSITTTAGTALRYWEPRLLKGERGVNLDFRLASGGRTRTFAGKLLQNLCENLCTAALNDGLAELEKNGARPVFAAHDEVVLEVEAGITADEVEQLRQMFIGQSRYWSDFKIDSDAVRMVRYEKN